MRPPLTSDTKKFWTTVYDFKKRFPFWCQTRSESPRPEMIPRRGVSAPFGNYCRVPYGDYAFWGFETAAACNRFRLAHTGEIWSP